LNADGLELCFIGRDQEADDARDVENFARNIQVTNEARSFPFPLQTFLLGAVWAMLAGLIAIFDRGTAVAAMCCLPFVLIVFNLAGLAYVAMRNKDPGEQRWSLRMANGRFTLRGERCAERTIALRDVIAFESGHRLSVIMGNGARIVLPCVRPMPLDIDPHAEIAQFLNDDLGRARSARVIGYRGEELSEDVEQGQHQGPSLERAAVR